MDKKEIIEVPHFEGYECIGLAVPCLNLPCSFLLGDCVSHGLYEADLNHRRLKVCYRKIKPKRYVFEETGEYRLLVRGDFWMDDEDIYKWESDDASENPYKVLRRVEDENE